MEKKGCEYRDCYVAYLDLLGFKDMVDESCCSEIYDIFEQVEATELKSPIKFINNEEENYPLDSVKKYIMSDSIVMYIEAKKLNSFNAIIKQCSIMAEQLLLRDKPILLRGGVSRGGFYRMQSVAFGPGLVSAYLMENTTKMPRIWIDSKILKDFRINPHEERFLYSEEGNTYISYFSMISIEKIQNTIESIERCKKEFVDENIIQKYEYVESRLKKECYNIC